MGCTRRVVSWCWSRQVVYEVKQFIRVVIKFFSAGFHGKDFGVSGLVFGAKLARCIANNEPNLPCFSGFTPAFGSFGFWANPYWQSICVW